jgi:hypothetical protein
MYYGSLIRVRKELISNQSKEYNAVRQIGEQQMVRVTERKMFIALTRVISQLDVNRFESHAVTGNIPWGFYFPGYRQARSGKTR